MLSLHGQDNRISCLFLVACRTLRGVAAANAAPPCLIGPNAILNSQTGWLSQAQMDKLV